MSCLSSVCNVALTLLVIGCEGTPAASFAINGTPLSLASPVSAAPGPAEPEDPQTNPFGEDAAAAQAGWLLFNNYNCSGCHGGHAGGGMGPSLRDGAWLYGNSDAALFSAIAAGRGKGMPAWGSKLPERQIWQLVSYVRALGTDSEPSAPDQTVPPPPFQH